MGKSPRDRAPVGRVQTGMASFCKAPPTAEQLEQQQLEEGQKFRMGKMMMMRVELGKTRRQNQLPADTERMTE